MRVRGLVPEERWRPPLRAHPRLRAAAQPTRARPSSRSSCTSRRGEQRRRLQERLDNPEKRWKFRLGDLDDRRHFGEYQAAYEDAIRETSTEWAPWYVVPADHNWVRNLAVAQILVETLERLDPKLPAPDPGLEGLQVV